MRNRKSRLSRLEETISRNNRDTVQLLGRLEHTAALAQINDGQIAETLVITAGTRDEVRAIEEYLFEIEARITRTVVAAVSVTGLTILAGLLTVLLK